MLAPTIRQLLHSHLNAAASTPLAAAPISPHPLPSLYLAIGCATRVIIGQTASSLQASLVLCADNVSGVVVMTESRGEYSSTAAMMRGLSTSTSKCRSSQQIAQRQIQRLILRP